MQELRPFQKEAISALNKTAHVICVAPTGSGKSLVYERAALCKGARVLLVSPLVALARQQGSRLEAAGVRARLYSGGAREVPAAGTGAWIVSPEVLQGQGVRSLLRRWRPNLLVVDECHCLWEWGESFRPAFAGLPRLIEDYGIKSSLWLSATLPGPARSELLRVLPDPRVEIGGFDLPEGLRLSVARVPWVDRADAILRWVFAREGDGLIFVPTRGRATALARLLAAAGVSAVAYHAGMSREERAAVESRLAAREVRVVVATSAFGMGMDYAHLRWCALWQAPPSLLSLAQSVGRVGRGGQEQGWALVLWDPDDFRTMEWMAGASERRKAELSDTRRFLESRRCRRAALRGYFDGAVDVECCGRCDVCCFSATHARI